MTRGTHSLVFGPSTKPIFSIDPLTEILVQAPSLSGHGFVTITNHGKGSVVVLGEELWWVWITLAPDNLTLLRHLITDLKEVEISESEAFEPSVEVGKPGLSPKRRVILPPGLRAQSPPKRRSEGRATKPNKRRVILPPGLPD